jgi:hypothetical protein
VIRRYSAARGIHGYKEGDILVCEETGERSLVVRTGAGLQLEPYKGSLPDDGHEAPVTDFDHASMGPAGIDDGNTETKP